MNTQHDTKFRKAERKSSTVTKSVRLDEQYIAYMEQRGVDDFSAYVRKLIEADMDMPVDFAERDDAKMRYWAEFIITRLSESVSATPPKKGGRTKKQRKLDIPDGLRSNIRRLLEDDED